MGNWARAIMIIAVFVLFAIMLVVGIFQYCGAFYVFAFFVGVLAVAIFALLAGCVVLLKEWLDTRK